ncbi:MAG: helix-turn-helix domain-containing protein [Acidobacteriota bacterium]
MKLSTRRLKALCSEKGFTLKSLLEQSGVSRTAYYSLVRRASVIPLSVQALAETLGVSPRAFLAELQPEERQARVLLREARRILRRNPGASFENLWHTLVLLEERPVDNLNRSLLRGAAIHFH